MRLRLFRPWILSLGLLSLVSCEKVTTTGTTPAASITNCKLTTVPDTGKDIELQAYSSVFDHVQLTSTDHNYLLEFKPHKSPFNKQQISLVPNQTNDQKITGLVETWCYVTGSCYYSFTIFNEDAGHALCQDPGVHIIKSQ